MTLRFEDDKIFKGLDIPASLAARLTAIRKRLREKYDIDYVEVDGIDKDNECILFNIDCDPWKEYLWESKYMEFSPEMEKEKSLATIKPNDTRLFWFFDEDLNVESKGIKIPINEHTALRASILGEMRQHGYAVMFGSGETGHKIQFCITFNHNRSIASLSSAVFFELMRDLKSAEKLLTPFLEFFKEHGYLREGPLLEKKLRDHPFSINF